MPPPPACACRFAAAERRRAAALFAVPQAVQILEKYFGLEEDEDQNLAPTMDPSGAAYSFGGGPPPMPPGGYTFGESPNSMQ